MTDTRLTYLLEKRVSGALSVLEWAELKSLARETDPETFQNLVAGQLADLNESGTPLSAEEARLAVSRIVSLDKNQDILSHPVPSNYRVHFLKTTWFRYAAVILILFGAGAYVWTTNSKKQTSSATALAKADVPPGGDKATLTLADGSKIVLDSAANGNVADQGGVQVVKLANGQIAYDLRGLSGKEEMWNIISTPRGGQYQVTLPDATTVWLNAASSITFPTAFTGNERKVKIDGEVYFEIAQNKQKPFFVDIHGESLVQVLGTRFNVNSYQDENAIRTTLVEGSVKVSKRKESQVLKPGEQAIVSSIQGPEINNAIKIQPADLDQALAWRNGLFNFNGLGLAVVMRQLERWYDIRVKYEGNVPDLIFRGKMYRSADLSDALDIFKKLGVNCRLEGKTLIVF